MAKIPQIVKKVAHDLIEIYGDHFDYLGKFEETDAYMYHFPDDACTGFPFVYLVKDDKVEEVSEEPALFIINSLIKDFDEVEIE